MRLSSREQFRGVWKPHHLCSTWPGESCLSFLCTPCVLVAGWLANWGHLPVFVLFVCLCLGRSSGPTPHVILALVYAGAPKPALCLCALSPVIVSVVCLFFGAVACVSLCLCGCAGLCESAPPVCPFRDLSIHPSVGAVSPAFPQGEGRTPLQFHQ